MKSGFYVAAVASLVPLFGASSVWANLLLAPGFENPPAPSASTADQLIPGNIAPSVPAQQNPWFYGRTDATKTGSNAYYSSDIPTTASSTANRINVGAATYANANDGHQYAYAFTAGQAAGQVTYVAQGVTGASIVAGDTYQASAFFFNKMVSGADGDRLQAGGSFDSLQLVFLDSLGAIISSAQSAAHVDSTTTAAINAWSQISFTAVAPVGTTSIVFENLLTRGASGGVLFVDSASLEDLSATPEPACIGLLAVGGTLALRRRR